MIVFLVRLLTCLTLLLVKEQSLRILRKSSKQYSVSVRFTKAIWAISDICDVKEWPMCFFGSFGWGREGGLSVTCTDR